MLLIIMIFLFIVHLQAHELAITFPKDAQAYLEVQDVVQNKYRRASVSYGRIEFHQDIHQCVDGFKASEIAKGVQTQLPLFLVVEQNPACKLTKLVKSAKAAHASTLIILTEKSQIPELDSVTGIDIYIGQLKLSKKFKQNSGMQGVLLGQIKVQGRSGSDLQAEVWGAAYDQHSYQLYSSLKKIITETPELAENINFKFRTALLNCNDQTSKCIRNFQDACVCGGTVCTVIEQGAMKKDFIEEDIRMAYVLQTQGVQGFLKYTTYFENNCLKEQCQQQEISQLNGLDLKQMRESSSEVLKSCKGNLSQTLKADTKAFKSIAKFPVLIINGVKYYQNDYLSIKTVLCKQIKKNNIELEGCSASEQHWLQHPSINWVIIGGTTLLGVLLFLWYRRRIGRQMESQMTMQINTSVSNYIEMSRGK